MLFNTLEFAVFFAVVFSLYFALQRSFKAQNLLIVLGSYFFYGCWDVRFLLLIVVSTAVDYCAAQLIERGRITARQKYAVSAYLLGSAFLFVLPDYTAITLFRSGFSYSATVDWQQLVAHEFGWISMSAVMILVIVLNSFNWLAGNLSEHNRRRFFAGVSIVTNLSILGFFKYFNFFAENFALLSENLFGITPGSLTLTIILPVGISFYTFQTISYTIDVYRRELKASDHLVEFAAYVAYFPQLVAGPIERGKRLLPQFREARPTLTFDKMREASWLIAWGLFKKLVIADNVALIVNTAFGPYDTLGGDAPVAADGLRLLVAVYAFAIQIYCDFSGYSDIARGLAKLMGFELMVNFRLPYFATSPSSFWRGWHISLSTWLRDYLYIPLGGNRGGSLRTTRNLTLTMLLGGLWHGAAWNFVFWGAYHGALLGVYRVIGLRTERHDHAWWVSGLLGLLMFQLTCVGWLLFRAQNISTIGLFLESIALHPYGSKETWMALSDLLFFSWFLVVWQIGQAVTGTLDLMSKLHWFVRLNVWIYVLMSLWNLASPSGQEFIYFAF